MTVVWKSLWEEPPEPGNWVELKADDGTMAPAVVTVDGFETDAGEEVFALDFDLWRLRSLDEISAPKYGQIFRDPDQAAMARVCWAEVIDHLQENGLATKTRLATADRYVRARVEYEFLFPEAMLDGPTKISPKGGMYFNYQWSALKKIGEELARFEDTLLISAKAADGKIKGRSGKTVATAADEFLSD